MYILKIKFVAICVLLASALSAPGEPDTYDIRHIQRALNNLGYQTGPIDGIWGPQTRTAMIQFSGDNNLDVPEDLINLILNSNFQRQLITSFNIQAEINEAEVQHLQTVIGYDDARHLLERTGIGAHPTEILALVGKTRSEAISSIVLNLQHENVGDTMPRFVFDEILPPYWMRWDGNILNRSIEAEANNNFIDLQNWWVSEMISTTKPARENLNLFWHNHFVAAYDGLEEQTHLIARQHLTIRRLGATSFRDLLAAMLREPAVLVYLNNDNNRREQPNENLARELLELFVLGEGNYSEDDIRGVARTLTGHSYNRLRNLEFEFKPWAHDYGTKRLLGTSGNFDGDDLPDILLRQPEAALFIARSFWSHYVSDFNSDENEIVRIAEEFRESDYDIKTLFRAIVSSEAFWASENRGTIVKSPLDLVIGTIRSSGDLPNWWGYLPTRLKVLGQDLFNPPNVAGWPGGSAWISPSLIVQRSEAIESLIGSAITFEEPQMISEATDGNNDFSMSEGQQNNIVIEYSAQNFDGPPEFIIDAISREAGNGYPQVVWRSDRIEAMHGVDTEQSGASMAVSMNSMEWQQVNVSPTTEQPLDAVRIRYINDKCCGPAGPESGDRNLFIRAVRFAGEVFPASSGRQTTNCQSNRDADQYPGFMYCPGELFIDLNIQSSETSDVEITSARQSTEHLRVARVAYEWGDRVTRSDDWMGFSVGLLRPNSSGIFVEAMIVRMVLRRSDRGNEVYFNFEEQECLPNCFGAPMPTSAFTDNRSGERRIDLALLGYESAQQQRQWAALNDNQRRFLSNIIVNFPLLIEMSQSGRNWEQRDGEAIHETWQATLEQVRNALPRSRYARYAIDGVVEIHNEPNETGNMMSMDATTPTRPTIVGLPGAEANWRAWTSQVSDEDLPQFFGFLPSEDMGQFDIEQFIRNPSYNLK